MATRTRTHLAYWNTRCGCRRIDSPHRHYPGHYQLGSLTAIKLAGQQGPRRRSCPSASAVDFDPRRRSLAHHGGGEGVGVRRGLRLQPPGGTNLTLPPAIGPHGTAAHHRADGGAAQFGVAPHLVPPPMSGHELGGLRLPPQARQRKTVCMNCACWRVEMARAPPFCGPRPEGRVRGRQQSCCHSRTASGRRRRRSWPRPRLRSGPRHHHWMRVVVGLGDVGVDLPGAHRLGRAVPVVDRSDWRRSSTPLSRPIRAAGTSKVAQGGCWMRQTSSAPYWKAMPPVLASTSTTQVSAPPSWRRRWRR